eukprot:31260-Pelagococcus_subviridis.AAC.27
MLRRDAIDRARRRRRRREHSRAPEALELFYRRTDARCDTKHFCSRRTRYVLPTDARTRRNETKCSLLDRHMFIASARVLDRIARSIE